MLRELATACICVLLCFGVFLQPALATEDIATLTKGAEQGRASAQYDLGVAYHEGDGVEQNYEKAFEWLQKAADQDFVPAWRSLGFMYTLGHAVPADMDKAVHYFTKAAEAGDAKAQYNLGLLYTEGSYIPQDFQKGFFWLEKAVAQDHAEAMPYLADYYLISNRGIAQDVPKAMELLETAASKDVALAWLNLGLLAGSGVLKSDTNKTAGYFTKAAEFGNAEAKYYLAMMYDIGEGVPKDPKKSLALYQEAAEAGVPGAQYNLAVMYNMGENVPQDFAKALSMYKAVADFMPLARTNIGYMYLMGQGMEANQAEALKYFEWAGDDGDAQGQFNAGLLNQEGRGNVKKDNARAEFWYKEAAKQNHPDAAFALGTLYEEIAATDPAALQNAYIWYGIAGEQGNVKALAKKNELGAKKPALQEAGDAAIEQ